MDEKLVDRLVEDAKRLAADTESAREAMMAAARRRQEAILALKAAGLSVRGIATRLESSPAVVQAALQSAVSRHPHTSRREERFPYELHVMLADKFREQPEHLRELARGNLERMRETQRAPIAESWLDRWEELLKLPLDEMEREMLRDDDMGRDMRQISPFAGALDRDDRWIAMKKAQLLATA
jgi:DNA-binding transcriptional MerR regulator